MIAVEINKFSEVLDKLIDKHLPKTGFVTFKLLAPPKPIEMADNEGRRYALDRLPASRRILREETITDPGTGRPLVIANLKGYRRGRSAGEPQEPTIGEIQFLGSQGGLIDVPVTDRTLFARLLLSNDNKDNPSSAAREPENGYVFGMVKPEADAQTKLVSKIAVGRALVAIDELTDEAAARAASKLNVATVDRGRQLDTAELKLQLSIIAEADPARVESVLEAGESKLDELVAKAVSLGLLDFVDEAQQWRWKETQQPITEAVQGYKPETALVMYIQNSPNGPRFSQTLANAVKGREKVNGKGKGK